MNPNVNIPNFGGDDAGQANLATQLSIAKAQKDEKSKEFYTEPIRMASQDMIMTGAKGLAGYLGKKTGLKAFGGLAADVATHGVAGGFARTAARAGNEAASVAGEKGRRVVAAALENNKDAIQSVAAGLPTSITSSAAELKSTVASRVSALGDQATALGDKATSRVSALGDQAAAAGGSLLDKAQTAIDDKGNLIGGIDKNIDQNTGKILSQADKDAGFITTGGKGSAAAAARVKQGVLSGGGASVEPSVPAQPSVPAAPSVPAEPSVPSVPDPTISLAAEQQRTADLGESSRGLNPAAASFEPAAQQGLNDLGILPKLGGEEQLGKLPSSVAAAKALREGGVVNTQRTSKSATTIISEMKAKRLAGKAAAGAVKEGGGSARLAATTARRDAAFGRPIANLTAQNAKSQELLDNIKNRNALPAAADKTQPSGVEEGDGGGPSKAAAPAAEPAGGDPVQDSASSGAGPTSATALDQQAAAAPPPDAGVQSSGDGAPSGGPGGGPDSGNTLSNKIDTGLNDAQNVVDADAAVDDAASAASKAAAAAKAAGTVESGLKKAAVISSAADETPVGDVITGVLGVASLIGGLFAGHSDEAPSAPAVGQMAQASTAGAGNNA